MDFIEAVKAAMDGKLIRRKVWADNASLYYRKGVMQNLVFSDNSGCLQAFVEYYLADDWETVPEQPKTLGFMEAIAELQKGKKICRLSRQSDVYLPNWSSHSNIFSRDDVLATDWIVVEKGDQ